MRQSTLTAALLLLQMAAVPALAAECKGARDPATKAVCTDVGVRTAEAAMAKTIDALGATSESTQRQALLADQRDWLHRRDLACLGLHARAPSCVADFDRIRTRDLSGTPVSGPGAGAALVPVLKGMDGTDTTLTWHASLFRFAKPATPAQAAFNATVDARLAHIPRNVGIQIGQPGTYVQRSEITYASPDLVSIRVDGSEGLEGDAQGLSWTENLNFDLRRGVPVTAASTLTPEGLSVLRETCLVQVADGMAANRSTDGHEPLPGKEEANLMKHKVYDARRDIDAATADDAHWEFGAEGLTVTYDVDAVAKHAEGTFSCKVGYDALRALAKPDATLPSASVASAATGG